MVTKVTRAALAKEIATVEQLHYGCSIFDGAYYVGTEPELGAAGVAQIFAGTLPKPKEGRR